MKLDVSKMNGQDFVDAIVGTGENCFVIEGEEQNDFLSKIMKPESTPMFKIGDKVCYSKETVRFFHLDKQKSFEVVGVEKVRDQYLYTILNRTARAL